MLEIEQLLRVKFRRVFFEGGGLFDMDISIALLKRVFFFSLPSCQVRSRLDIRWNIEV